MKKLKNLIFNHKIISLIVLAAICYGGHFVYKKKTGPGETVQHITAQVKKGMLISSISGSGQVSASNQMEIKSKVSGEIIELNVKTGQEVKEGEIIAKIDSQAAARSLNDANASLAAAQLELAELLSPPDKLDLLQAENAVLSAKNSLDKLLAGASESDIKQAENSLTDAKDAFEKLKLSQEAAYSDALAAKAQSETNLDNGYESAYNDIADFFLDAPDIVTGAYTILFSAEIADSERAIAHNWNKQVLKDLIYPSEENYRAKISAYIDLAEANYNAAEEAYDEIFDEYKDTNRYSDHDTIENLIDKTIETAKKISDTIKSETNMLDAWIDYRSDNDLEIYAQVTDYQPNLAGFMSEINGHLSSLLSARDSLDNYKEDISDAERDIEEMEHNQPLELAAAERSVEEKEDALVQLKAGADEADIEAAKRSLAEKEASLEKLKAGAADLEIRNRKLAVQQKNNSVVEARETYDSYSIKAPFGGVIASVDIAKGDNASSGSAIAVLITKERIAEITLNEIDAAKVKHGQKVNLTFDAIPDLSIAGEVAEIDTIGAVSQGVVSYNVKIAFSVQDERVKPGMSISASIITESKSDVLLAPISAVKVSVTANTVQILANGQPQNKNVVTGLSNDTMIEIVSGLEDGEEIITQTISSSAASSNTSSKTQSSQQRNSMQGIGMMRMMR